MAISHIFIVDPCVIVVISLVSIGTYLMLHACVVPIGNLITISLIPWSFLLTSFQEISYYPTDLLSHVWKEN